MIDRVISPLAWVNGSDAPEKSSIDLGFMTLAGATHCDIPLTLRGVSRGVTLVTAHTQDDSQLNWQALTMSGTTLVCVHGCGETG